MGKSAGRAPAAPDPRTVAAAQETAGINAARTTAELNRINTTTPFGSLTYRNVGEEDARRHVDFAYQEFLAGRYKPLKADGTPFGEGETPIFDWNAQLQAARGFVPNANQWEATQTLSPEAQALVDNLFQDAGANGGRARVEEALFSRMNPLLDRDREGLESRLRNQGLTPGTEAWTNAMGDFGRNVNDARLAVTAQAGNEQARAIQALLQMAGAAPAVGGGGGGVNVSPVDMQSLFGNQQAADMAAYNTRAQNAASGNAAAAGIASAAITAAAVIA